MEPNSLWSVTVRTLYGTTDTVDLAKVDWISYGLKDILNLGQFFRCSIVEVEGGPQLQWRWTTDGLFSVKSAYARMRDPGVSSVYHKRLWKIKAPPKVKLFIWLTLMDRLLTQENLEKRGWPSIQSCTLCNQTSKETSTHLFLTCPFASSVWHEVTGAAPRLQNNLGIQQWWLKEHTGNWTGGDTRWAATLWNIWKTRNCAIFQNKHPSVWQTVARTRQDMVLWTTRG